MMNCPHKCAPKPERTFELPPMFYEPTRILDELEADVNVNAVPGGPALWKRVLRQERAFTATEIYLIYVMLSMGEPDLHYANPYP